jgi:hypothetical protein
MRGDLKLATPPQTRLKVPNVKVTNAVVQCHRIFNPMISDVPPSQLSFATIFGPFRSSQCYS